MIKLGQEVKDRVTGFQGIVVSRHTYQNGCDRLSVQPPVDKEGKIPETHTFDEPDLSVVGDGVLTKEKPTEKPKKTGGPHGHKLELR